MLCVLIASLTIASAAMAAVLPSQRDSVIWVAQGCYTDTSTSRTLASSSAASTNMTIENCIKVCSDGGYNLAGVEFADECYCDYTFQSTGIIAHSQDCNLPCSGNKNEKCGAGNYIDVYWNGHPFPVAPPTAGTYTYQGCYADNVNGRALPHQQAVANATVDKCTAACKDAGYNVAGLEAGRECWCNLQLPSTPKLNDNACATACTGNTNQLCGGTSKLTVYSAIVL
ncbi:hypothetical protein MIND_00767100 [Mycena indigotica]|uniref:WSC domain-containing protein n=1 Tax=Mycena indigotica TaxID=2126181 RepID=A0A8H6SLV5_9AGAR|nr:uncharacterized protein MIND_00767100 [Mycena indigotica]KAF7302008.1 hypothetical protein MIND_00767100 [Mycena indigotica]